MPWHMDERHALVTALREAGPGAATLCEGWATEDLAAHVVLRESTLVAAAGIVVPPLAARTERQTKRLGARANDQQGYEALLGRVARGPARLHPLAFAGDAAQLVEMHVHTEDVRRRPGQDPDPRPLPDAHVEALHARLVTMAKMLYRNVPAGVVLRDPSGRTTRVRRVPRPGRDATPEGLDVVVEGPVGELVLHAFERSTVARVTVRGPDQAVAAVHAARPPRVT
ncbi:TIGR03085 family metal-binding protein [Cellulomonas bogoriensis]|uniref:Mycothiol-dependent maleylpyruvate isomerase metal-binding domain-containing protein n=1 Tax=Cellulomonas bogoriensis 69B4 = DSM 16987 TaxID=1386082 RepID=A0A0A0C142_9CELL|nr:TIGR03085 family metal-binding protein [Cellulomonas bogoriensis]KGM14353.1 hypothetical protein N869_13950 [Cellulomonas bogoriensis 69B4 = DSM 16987]